MGVLRGGAGDAGAGRDGRGADEHGCEFASVAG